MVGMVLLLLSLAGICVFMADRWKLHIEETPLLVSAIVTMLLYFSSLFGLLRLSAQLLFWLGLILWLFTLILRRKALSALVQTIVTPGSVLFAIGVAALYWASRNAVFSSWDEFSHWGLMWKLLYSTHQLPQLQNALLFPSYPPATALYQYYFSSLSVNKESIAIFAQLTLVWAAVLPLTKGLKWKQFALVLLAAFIGFVCYIRYNIGFWYIYQDGLLGMLFAGGFALYWSCRPEKYAPIKAAPVLMLMALTKETGMMLSALLCLIILVDSIWMFINREQRFFIWFKAEWLLIKNREFKVLFRRNWHILASCLLILAPLAASLSWSLHLKAIGLQTSSNLVALPAAAQWISSAIFGIRTPQQNEIVSRFFASLISIGLGPTTPGMQWLLSIAGCTGLAISCCVLMAAVFHKETKPRRLLLVSAMLLLAVVAFLLGLFFLYFFIFGSTALPSYSRYASTIALAAIMIACHLLIQHAASASKAGLRQYIAGAMAVLLACTLSFSLPRKYMNVAAFKVTGSTVRQTIAASAMKLKTIGKADDNVYVVWQGTTGQSFYMSRYEFFPMICNKSRWNIGRSNPGDEWSTYDYTAQQWADILKEYQYIYIGKADETFWDRYGVLFADAAICRSKKVFKVVSNLVQGIQIIPID